MNTRKAKFTSQIVLAAGVLAGPSSAIAAGGSLFEGLVMPLIGVGVLFWLAYFFYTPFRSIFVRIPRRASNLWTLVLGVALLVFAAVSALIGKTTLGGSVIVATHEPIWFWNVIKLQAAAGCIMLVLGLLTRPKSK